MIIPDLQDFKRDKSFICCKFVDRINQTQLCKRTIPSWLDKIPIDEFEVHGKISRDERALLKSRFKQIRINPRTF
jgi:hypothetical protein